MTNTKPITLDRLFRYYRNLPHQAAAIQELEDDIKANGYAAAMRRDRPWFSTWSQSGKQRDYQAAIALIQKFEGFHHDAYLCPAGVWSIGWGNTKKADGTAVGPGDRITQAAGDALLNKTVSNIVSFLDGSIPHWSALNEDQQSALISFAYNVGSHFYGQTGFETISRCLREQDYASVPDALLLYRNPGSSFEAGLKRRRIAEGKLWTGDKTTPTAAAAKLTVDSPFSSRLTPHITLGEFALGQEARRFDHQHQLDTAAELAAFLERVRSRFGGPVIITSGYRPPAINRSVGGASKSEHLFPARGEGAVDFYVKGASINAVQSWCDEHWPCSLGYGAKRGFVHIGIRQGRPHVRWDY